jgi:apolipoprotein N-acyltransferase
MMTVVRLLLAVASGLLLYLAFPPLNVELTVWFWIIPLLYALWSSPTPKPAKVGWLSKVRRLWPFFLGWASGFAFFCCSLAWIRHSSRVVGGARGFEWMGWEVEAQGWMTVVGLSGYLAVYWGLWAWFAATIGKPKLTGALGAVKGKNDAIFDLSTESLRSAFLNAALWVGCEWVRGTLFTGFGWNTVAIPLISKLTLVQAADMVGVVGLSFLPIFCACILYNTVLRFQEEARTSRVRPHLDFFVAAVLLLGDFAYGFHSLSAPQHEETVPLHVLMVQLNVAQADKWSGRKTEETKRAYADITHKFLVKDGPQKTDVVIWPESALPGPLYDPNDAPWLQEVLGYGNFSLVAGVDIYLPNELPYTGAVLFTEGLQNLQIYRKVHLVPYGEYLPMRSFPLVHKLLGHLVPGDFGQGTSTEPFKLKSPAGVQLIPLICFEDTVGDLARQFVRDAPQLIVNCTNDGWFLHSEENEYHLMHARFRCVELHLPMVRAANTGVTCYVGPDGRINRGDRLENPKTGSVFVRGALPKEVHLRKNASPTFYAEHGDLFSMVMLGIAVLSIPATLLIRRSAAPVPAQKTA